VVLALQRSAAPRTQATRRDTGTRAHRRQRKLVPSGDPTPSQDDISVTRDLVEAGNLLEIELLDHLVIGGGRWVSMKQQRLGFD
jgi:RadC-like JAB domain